MSTSKNIISILKNIQKNKTLLFASYRDCLVYKRAAKWREIYNRAVRFELAPKNKPWFYMMEVVWEEWKNKTLSKIYFTNAEKTNGRIIEDLYENDMIIVNILGLKLSSLVPANSEGHSDEDLEPDFEASADSKSDFESFTADLESDFEGFTADLESDLNDFTADLEPDFEGFSAEEIRLSSQRSRFDYYSKKRTIENIENEVDTATNKYNITVKMENHCLALEEIW